MTLPILTGQQIILHNISSINQLPFPMLIKVNKTKQTLIKKTNIIIRKMFTLVTYYIITLLLWKSKFHFTHLGLQLVMN